MRLFACGQFSCSHIGVVPADVRTRGSIPHVACVQRRCWMTSSQSTSYGYGSRIALRLCGTTAVDLVCRHCERSEAIHWHIRKEGGLLRCARNDGVGTARKHPPLSFRDAPLGAGPESISTDGGDGFRARCCASPRNDGGGFVCCLR